MALNVTFHSLLGSAVGIISSSDAENDPVVYSIAGGANQAYFEIETVLNELVIWAISKQKLITLIMKQLKTYVIIDVNGSPYVPLQVEITVADNYGSTSQIFNAALFNNIIANSPPLTSPVISNIDENAPVETVIYDVEATDPEDDTITYSLELEEILTYSV